MHVILIIAKVYQEMFIIRIHNFPVFCAILHRNEKKEAFFKAKEKEKINEKRKEELKRTEKKDKDKQAIDEYEKWLVGIVC